MKKVTDIRMIKLLGYGLSTGFCGIAIAMFIFFHHFGVRLMMGYNIFSICFYLFSYVILHKGDLWLYAVSVYLEVVLHMSLAVVYVGVDSGFQIILIGMNLLAFYSEYMTAKSSGRRVNGLVLSSIGLIVFFFAYIYSWFFPPAYVLPKAACFWMQLICGLVVFWFNVFFLKLFVSSALYSEGLLADAQSQANSMVTALSSDYKSVYYVNLDTDTGICYRRDPKNSEQTPEGEEFAFYSFFSEYCRKKVNENYREGFMNYIDPDNIRENLAEKPIIAYRYLARRGGREYYEMIRMAGVRRLEERDDHIVHSIGLGISDIDEEMRETLARNETLAEALTLAEEASKAKTAFLSSMSHEIRTPMNAIIGLDTLALHDDTLPGQTREYLEKIGASAKHLLSLINDILDMSRIESGRMVLRVEEFSFSAMLEQINTMVTSQCSDKGISYECNILNQVDDNYIGDDMKLKEVLLNILSNAIKFTEAPGSVTLSVERTAMFEDQSTLQFGIKDTGIGMDKDYIPRIFDAFSQEDSSRKNKYGSTGLGMAITKNLVEMMNGTIDVESEKGVGTEFTVVITLRNAVHRIAEADGAIDPAVMHVLVADEDEMSAGNTALLLEEAGVRTDVCMNRNDILKMMDLQRIKKDPYNIILLDQSDTDGPETVTEIRKHYDRECTAIIQAAYSWDDLCEAAERAGADGFLTKPLSAEDVIREFRRIAQRNNMKLSRDKKRAKLEGRRILLAEDMEINAEIMMAILEMNEMEADHAENGRIVVEMFEKSPVGTYSAVLMDIRMPEMDGLEAAEAIRNLDREDAAKIPIIALTANAFDEDVQSSLQAGMNAHLSKPVDPDQLIKTLGELIYETEKQG